MATAKPKKVKNTKKQNSGQKKDQSQDKKATSLKDQAPEKEPETPKGQAPEKKTGTGDQKPWKRYQDVFRKVEEKAHCPGVGEISVTLIEVSFGEETFRTTTRKKAQEWLRGKRKEKSEEKKREKAEEKQKKEMEKAAKIAPYITMKLAQISDQIQALAAHVAVDEDDETTLVNAAELIMSAVDNRNRKEGEKEKSA